VKKLFEPEEEIQGIDLSGMQMLLPIIGLITILLIGFFAYNYFIGDIKEIEFNANDLTGTKINNFTVMISNEKGEIIETVKGTETIKLRKGNYSARIIASGYKTSIQNIEVTRNNSFEFNLTAEINANFGEIQGLNEFILAGEKIQAKIIINSSSSIKQKTTISFKEDFLNVFEKTSITDKEIELNPGKNEIEIELQVKSKSALSKYLNKDLTGVLSIKEAPEITKNYSFKTGVLESNDLILSEKKINFNEIKAGENKSETIIASNKNELIEFENIDLSIEITSKGITSEEEILSWLELTPQTILELKPNEQQPQQITLTALIPFNAVRQRIIGNIILSVQVMGKQEQKKIEFDFTIKEAEIGLELIDFPENTIELIKIDSETSFPPKLIDFFIENTGEIKIETISITRNCEPYESNSWISLTKQFISQLNAKEKQKITLHINPITTEEQKIPCWLYVSYLNPGTTTQEKIQKSFNIQLKSIKEETEE
jgi:hypothetical protein